MAEIISISTPELPEIQQVQDAESIKQAEKRKVVFSAIFAGIFLTAIWAIFAFDAFFDLHLARFGLHPRSLIGLRGILFSPFIHGDLNHIASNSLPLFLLFAGAIYFYRGLAFSVLWKIWLLTGIAVWIFGRDSLHIGASGIVYGLASFMAISGMLRNDTRLLAVSFLTIFLYGGMVWGVLPLFKHISWESHLAGALSGIYCAVIYRKQGPPLPVYFKDEEELEIPEEEIEIPVIRVNPDDPLQDHTGYPGIRIYYRVIPNETKIIDPPQDSNS
jgi:membrane associated rhomboid family serine protease